MKTYSRYFMIKRKKKVYEFILYILDLMVKSK